MESREKLIDELIELAKEVGKINYLMKCDANQGLPSFGWEIESYRIYQKIDNIKKKLLTEI